MKSANYVSMEEETLRMPLDGDDEVTLFTTDLSYHLNNASAAGEEYDIWGRCNTFVSEYRIIPSLICFFVFVFGVLYCLFGYRLFKATMFITGFVFGSSIVFFVCVEENVLPVSGKIGASVGAGLICGLLAMLVLYVGLFMTGFECGLLCGVLFFTILEIFYHPLSQWIPIGSLLGVGLVFALLSFYWQKGLVVLGTSLLGSGMVLLAIDYFADAFRMTQFCYDRLMARRSTVVLCWFSWLLFAFWPALSFVSLLAQWRITAVKFDHRSVGPKLKVNKGDGKRKTHRPETDQHHYRHLYQIRRMNGDVLTKSYMKRVEESQLQLLSSSTDAEDSGASKMSSKARSDVVMTRIVDVDDETAVTFD